MLMLISLRLGSGLSKILMSIEANLVPSKNADYSATPCHLEPHLLEFFFSLFEFKLSFFSRPKKEITMNFGQKRRFWR